MLLNEIFDTNPDVKWKKVDNTYYGIFDLEDHKYKIHLDEYELKLSKVYSLIDFGFTRDGEWTVAAEKKMAAKVFGALFNSMVPKIRELNPDIIMFGINNKNSAIESRKSLYEKLAIWYCKGSAYEQVIKWVQTPNGEYTLLAKGKLVASDIKAIEEYANKVPLKN